MDKLALPTNNHPLPQLAREAPSVYIAPPPPTIAYRPAGQPEPNSLLEYWELIRRHKTALFLFLIVGIGAGVVTALVRTPVYQAHTTLEIEDINPDSNVPQVNPISNANNYTALADLQTQVQLLGSEKLLKRVLGKLKDSIPSELEAHGAPSGIAAPLLRWWRQVRNQGPAAADPPGDRDAVNLTAAAHSLKVTAGRQTRIIDAAYNSTDPRFAAAFANTLAQEFINSNMEARSNMSRQTEEWLSGQLEEMRAKLEQSEDALQSYARNNGLMFTTDKTPVSEEKLRELQDELLKAQADRVALQSHWEISKSSSPDALPDVLGDTSLRALQDKITELRRQKADLMTIYTDQDSKVERLDSQIVPLEAALEKERASIIARVGNDYQAAVQREKLLGAAYAEQSGLVTDQAQKSIQYNLLKHEADSDQQLYDAMLEHVKEASIASALRATNVRVVDPADIPTAPYKPSLSLDAGMGLFSGLLAGFAFVLMRERADRPLQAPGEMESWLNVPELQAIPALAYEEADRLLSTQRSPGDPKLTLLAPIGRDPATPALASSQHKPSLMAECFRSLLTSILLSGESSDRPRLLVLTSAGPGEGKTTVVSNLGIVLAQIKRRVLIIDADMRKPQFHKIFGLQNHFGLGNLLDGRPLEGADLKEAIKEAVQQTDIPGLFVLPSGPPTQSAINLLYSEKLPILLAKFKQHFDMVLIDTPPMLIMPDARVLGRMADGVILVTRAGHTMRDAAIAAHQRLAEDKIRILGTILNYWDPKKRFGGYGYGYQYNYYQAG